ncbi:DedA family protein [Chamaesiphon sp. OTE_75_metabat_556]|uniref:DedA family protein n=1 Tax=Chamaesiphon sp. OTE_75_metabat_556 TaxID=2964692 RepID=UPI00286D315A|nr:DedA family protein [Chamaesiphon sp. OTE_75_metabat_556]
MEFLSLETIQELANQYGYLAVFVGILLENLGVPLPGETITIVGGFLAGSGELNYWFVLGTAAMGAFIGGIGGYFVGNYGGWKTILAVAKIFRIQELQLEEIKTKFSDNAVRAVFFGRFIPLIRIFSSPMAGVVEMPFGKFLAVNLAGAITWASVMTTLAFFVGRIVSLEQLLEWVSKFAILALFIAIGFIAVPIWLESRTLKSGEGE